MLEWTGVRQVWSMANQRNNMVQINRIDLDLSTKLPLAASVWPRPGKTCVKNRHVRFYFLTKSVETAADASSWYQSNSVHKMWCNVHTSQKMRKFRAESKAIQCCDLAVSLCIQVHLLHQGPCIYTSPLQRKLSRVIHLKQDRVKT